jgi:hypothetical protein
MEIIIVVYLPFAGYQKSSSLLRPQKQKSPLFASGLKSFTAFAYNRAPRTNVCGLLNRYANQRVAIRLAVMLDVLIIAVIVSLFFWRLRRRGLVYFVSRSMTTGFYRAPFAPGEFAAARAAKRG